MPYDRSDMVYPGAEQQGDQLRFVRQASPDALRHVARSHDWRFDPEPVLTWIMAQKAMDLATALTVFLNGEPERFNYLAKREVPEPHVGAARALDNICLRVNSGFYRVARGQKLASRARLETWLEFQQADRSEGRRGRWILDERIVENALRSKMPQTQEPLPDINLLKPIQGTCAAKAFWGELKTRVFKRKT